MLDGTRLGRIDLGRNIRAGAHYTQFLAVDFDGDGTLPALVNVSYVNLTVAQPWAHAYIAANMSRGSQTQRAYNASTAYGSYQFKECWSTATATTPTRR